MDARSLRIECLRLAASFCYRGPEVPVAVSHVLKVAADFEEYAGAVPAALGRDAKGRFAAARDERTPTPPGNSMFARDGDPILSDAPFTSRADRPPTPLAASLIVIAADNPSVANCYRAIGANDPIPPGWHIRTESDPGDVACVAGETLTKAARGWQQSGGAVEMSSNQLAGNYANTIEGHAQLERDLAARNAKNEASQKAASDSAEQAANYAFAELSGSEQHLPSIGDQPKSFLDRLYGKLGGSDE